MALEKELKKKIIGNFKQSKNDSGSPEIQVALLTERINSLEDHFKSKPKDHHSRRGLIRMVSRRKKLLTYIKRNSEERYQELIGRLGLRK